MSFMWDDFDPPPEPPRNGTLLLLCVVIVIAAIKILGELYRFGVM